MWGRVTLFLGGGRKGVRWNLEMCKKGRRREPGRKYFLVLISCVWQHRFSSEVSLKWIEMKLYLWMGIVKVRTTSIGWIAFLLSFCSLLSFPPRTDFARGRWTTTVTFRLYRPAEVLCLFSIDVKQSQLNWSRTTNQVIRKLIEWKGHS